MASGVGVSDECNKVYRDLKLGKIHKYIIFGFSPDLREIVVEKSSSSTDYDEFLSDLPEDQCKWAVYDFEYETEGKRNKLCFISWSPDEAKIKSKMLFAASREALRRKLDGIAVEIQGTELAEVSYETVLAKAKSQSR